MLDVLGLAEQSICFLCCFKDFSSSPSMIAACTVLGHPWRLCSLLQLTRRKAAYWLRVAAFCKSLCWLLLSDVRVTLKHRPTKSFLTQCKKTWGQSEGNFAGQLCPRTPVRSLLLFSNSRYVDFQMTQEKHWPCGFTCLWCSGDRGSSISQLPGSTQKLLGARCSQPVAFDKVR